MVGAAGKLDGPAIRAIADGDVEAVVALWDRCGLTRPWNDARADIAFARASADAEILVAEREGGIAAAAMLGHDGHRGALYYLAVEPALQGRGLGRAMMAAAEAWLRRRGVRKLNLMVRGDNEAVRGFYKALGYVEEPRIVCGRWLGPRADE